MNSFQTILNAPTIFIEISHGSIKALNGESGLELPLERDSGGRLTDSCKEKLTVGFQEFLTRKSWQPRVQAYCAIDARGVSFRRITMPAAAKEEFHRLLLMQVESEFPLPPDELAWGFRTLSETRNNGSTKRELLVAAVRKEVIEDYAALFSRCGIHPLFTLSALARSAICSRAGETYAILDVADSGFDLALFENGAPASVRTIHANGAFEFVAKSLNGNWPGKKLFLAGSEAGIEKISAKLDALFTGKLDCERIVVPPGPGRSAAVLGLKKSVEENGALLLLRPKQTNGKTALTRPAPLKWAALAGALVIALILLPYAEAMALKPWLAKRFSALQADAGRLAMIDRELSFMEFLKQNQPPYLDALYLFSKFAPSGARIESLNMNRRGEVSLRGSMRNSDQVTEFRSKLIASGFFSNVTVEEQTPTPDGQKVNLRFTAQWKPYAQLQTVNIGPSAKEIEEAKNRKDSPPGMPPGFPAGAMPMGLPPGIQMSLPPGALPPGVKIPSAPPGTAVIKT
ncbi:MAG TPA: hypothetical protein VFM25_09325, partial [Verrucomicrobiae bacterium]|nr:hypothetical protein [Verrucomicrobiae bacterium]